MNDTFITENFLLHNKTAVELYHDYAEAQPIIDYHCHLSPKDIAENKKFANLTQIWLYGDHYKWRAMRTNGVGERFITGNASDWEKLLAWAETVPKTLRNPLYHWTHMELKRPFGISDKLLNKDTAKEIWEICNAKLAQEEFSVRGILQHFDVRLVCTTDDPIDNLEYHQLINNDHNFGIKILPAFRPDKGMFIENGTAFRDWVNKLTAVAEVDINSFSDYLTALRIRRDFFHAQGCRLSDHGIETAYAEDYTEAEIKTIFKKALEGKPVATSEALKFKSAMLYELGLMYHEKGWVQQFHLGALRNNNSRMFRTLGPDTGFDSIGDFEVARPLAKLLNRLDDDNKLPKTILYNLNPRDNELMATMIGNFQDGSVAGKMQYGSAWWFLDQLDGMKKQLEALSNMGLLSRFIGMLTDSRSFLSYPRHDYFRRLLCNLLGEDMERGLIPKDMPLVGNMVADICFNNANDYFGFGLSR
ncbi:glucuronate isomerase [candidate division KSB1 bacterium]|nr:MAG: glucuronate isomerase [candidate division KSB1 bacterium]MBC6949052.1 glucuronate isomerase [candidate division KSB1 bacterium]MCE7943668.1 glucuronate isomerase [Chlorobi bacterium CHB1]MDL1877277.1 glucuronate isomerase [Cytophagia bacterium CHB2]